MKKIIIFLCAGFMVLIIPAIAGHSAQNAENPCSHASYVAFCHGARYVCQDGSLRKIKKSCDSTIHRAKYKRSLSIRK